MIQVLISLIILISYVLSVCKRWGVPESISQTWFDIKRKWIFSVVVAVCLGLLMQPLMMVLPEIWQWLGFLMIGGGLMVAFAPNLDDDMEEKVHMTGAVIMGVASQIIVVVLELAPLLMMWTMGAYMMWQYKEKKVFIAEIIGGACLYLAVIIRLYMP